MKARALIPFCFMLHLVSGCTFRNPEAKPPVRPEDKARAEAARREMDVLPTTFQTPDFFKKNDSETKSGAAPAKK